MIDFRNRIEEAFNAVSAKRLIFNKPHAVYDRLIPFLILSMFFSISIIGLVKIYSDLYDWILFSVFVLSCFSAVGFFIAVNHHAKKRLLELGIRPSAGIFKEWANTEYAEYRMKKLYKRLCSNKLLTKTVLDVELLTEYRKLFEGESTHFYKPGFILGGVFVAFLIPVWNQYLALVFKTFEFGVKNISIICLVIVLLVIVCFFTLEFLRFNFDETRNRKSIRYKNISRDLELLRLSLRLKYKV